MLEINIPLNLLIIVSVIILILVIACIAYIIYKDRKKDDEEIDEILDDLMKAKPRENLINAKIEVPIGENIKPTLKEEKLDLDDMLAKMQKSLDSKQEQVVENFEAEQEEKAIISYQELLNSMKNNNLEEEIKQNELQQEKTATSLATTKVTEFLEREEPKIKKIESLVETKEKKFKNTDFISPIFGRQEAKIEYPTIKLFDTGKHVKKEQDDLINEIDEIKNEPVKNERIIKVSTEIDTKNDEFLRALKEFRSNL